MDRTPNSAVLQGRDVGVKTILIDGLSALQGGGQTYLKNLFDHLPDDADFKVVALLPDGYQGVFGGNSAIRIVSPLASDNILMRGLWYWWRLKALVRLWHADVLYCPGGMLSARRIEGCRTAVAFRNMLPFATEERRRYPFGYNRVRLWLLSLLQGGSFRNADLVIFISHYAKSVIDILVRNRHGRSVVIPHGLSEHFRVPQARPADPRLAGDYVLYVSIVTVYKAQLDVVRAWKQLKSMRQTVEKLVLVGPEYGLYAKQVRKLVAELGLENDVILAGNVPYADLPGYYQHAKVNIFASSCENCPNILLEAMAGGRPILCSDFQPMPEFARGAAEYFDPYDPAMLAGLLARYLDDAPLREKMGRVAAAESQRFQWAEAARNTWQALAALANKA